MNILALEKRIRTVKEQLLIEMESLEATLHNYRYDLRAVMDKPDAHGILRCDTKNFQEYLLLLDGLVVAHRLLTGWDGD